MSRSSPQPIGVVTAPRSVAGYHGCSAEVAARVLAGDPLATSRNPWDWLGQGVYFWEYGPVRARQWAEEHCGSGEPAVLEARIRLGRCLNLMDAAHFTGLRIAYEHVLANVAGAVGLRNTERGLHKLDRRVVDGYCDKVVDQGAKPFQTVRGCFPEGEPVFAGSKILSLTHVQIAVRDPACISRVRLVNFM